jgi:excisionase family DNA binding protein
VTVSIVPPDLAALAALLDVQEVAALINCSARHVYRLSDSGRMPPPVRLGSLVRWRRQQLLDWLDAGCPVVRGASR